MKLQHLAVIFIIIIMPISMVLSTYVNNLIDVSNKEAKYDALLLNSTYDAVRTYQMNTMNNSFADVYASRVRDINASVNSFFNSLATGMSVGAYTKNELNEYVPALLFTLYDGFYEYGPYDNYAKIEDGKLEYSKDNGNTEYGLKPYTYYSCEYKGSDYHLIVNYTLDNYISVMGTYNGNEYITGSGYYIDPNIIDNDSWDDAKKTVTIKHGGNNVVIEPEELGEFISAYDSVGIIVGSGPNSQKKILNQKTKFKYYNYINVNQVKYYWDDDPVEYPEDENYPNDKKEKNNSYSGIPIFRLKNNLKEYVSSVSDIERIAEHMEPFDDLTEVLESKKYINSPDDPINRITEKEYKEKVFEKFTHSDFRAEFKAHFKDINNYNYYKNAADFSGKIHDALKNITVSKNAENKYETIKTESFNKEYKIETSNGYREEGFKAHEKYSYTTPKVLDYREDGNDPELESSSFNQHRMDVIISCIEDRLSNSIANFNKYQSATYDYRMPSISEADWNKIANNVNAVAFLQGLVVGNYKFYNNYAVVADTKNKEFISKDAIYVQNTLQDNDKKESNYKTSSANYHTPGCKKFHKDNSRNVTGYRLIDYEVDSLSHEYSPVGVENGSLIELPKDEEVVNYYMQPGTGAYECIVSRNQDSWTYDELMKGTKNDRNDSNILSDEVRRAYISALAREKGAGYKNLSLLNY